ncbi:MAG: maleylpyruvate isomerase family mycothiol-dependent enzyme [Caldilineaceae bacterium]|nr:maleylpyruvate isomerase family mycothiol-dependent enzyme [Caldilineaceae bacterium]
MATLSIAQPALNAAYVPYVTAEEAHTLLSTALDRFLALVESLAADDWMRPTACTEWNVRDMIAHQVGGYASGTGYREMLRQYSVFPKNGQLIEDTINQRQIQKWGSKSPADLIAELRQIGPIAARKWAYEFRLIKPIFVFHPIGGRLSMRHLMWVIHSRDTWMHRLDICRATGLPFQQTPEHDGRIVALVMRDVARCLHGKLSEQAVIFDLGGIAGGVWKVGNGEAAATIQMDALDFNILASGRFTYDEGRARAVLSGDASLAESALKKTLVLY